MKRFISIVITFAGAIGIYSQKLVKVSTTYTYYAPETMSVEEAKRTALDRAKIQAIADEFGTIVSQSTSTIISNSNDHSNTHFYSLGGSDVKGEWIETIGTPEYDIKFENHFLVAKCTVSGKIREITPKNFYLVAQLLRNGLDSRFESNEFRDGDSMYLLFKSPVDGYLQIYFVDRWKEKSYRILPYINSHHDSYKINKNETYIFFSQERADNGKDLEIDEFTLTCDSGHTDFNYIAIIFSSNEIMPPLLSQPNKTTPKEIGILAFERWKQNLYKDLNNIQIISKPITINN